MESYGTISLADQQCGAAAPARTPQVAVHHEVLSKEIANHGDLLDRLIKRLEPVLSIVPPPNNGIEKQGNEPTCALAGAINGHARTIAAQSRLIEQVLSRLEI